MFFFFFKEISSFLPLEQVKNEPEKEKRQMVAAE